MAQVLPTHENPGWDKRVESSGLPCLDEGSIPSSSTLLSVKKEPEDMMEKARQFPERVEGSFKQSKMGKMNLLNTIFHFYLDGFRQMTLGRTLWALILVKLFVIFVVLRIFFFRPAMQGMTPEEKQQHVAGQLARPLNST